MHLELPKARLSSLRDFAKHYLMIVLSILTALGLEAWIERTHHRHAAAETSARIDAEIRANLAEIRTAMAQDARQEKELGQLRDRLVQDFKAHTPDPVIVQHILAQTTGTSGFNLNLRWPTLRHEAWDVAVADQSASWIEPAQMQRYSAAYATQRDTVSGLGADLALTMNGPRLVDTLTDLRIGAVQPREFLHVVGQMAAILSESQGNLRVLKRHLGEALEPGTPGANAGTH